MVGLYLICLFVILFVEQRFVSSGKMRSILDTIVCLCVSGFVCVWFWVLFLIHFTWFHWPWKSRHRSSSMFRKPITYYYRLVRLFCFVFFSFLLMHFFCFQMKWIEMVFLIICFCNILPKHIIVQFDWTNFVSEHRTYVRCMMRSECNRQFLFKCLYAFWCLFCTNLLGSFFYFVRSLYYILFNIWALYLLNGAST